MDRRLFLKKTAGFTGMVLSGLAFNPAKTYSRPTNLRITDIRGCTIASQYDFPIIKIYTNQDVYGLGEVRDAGDVCQALILKPWLVGKDPLEIEEILRSIKHFGGHGRTGGGYSAIDMALMDIAGKVLGVPAYRLLGRRMRRKIPIYADTYGDIDLEKVRKYTKRRLGKGFKHFKIDLRPWYLKPVEGAQSGGYPTEKGLAVWGEYVQAVRDIIGYDVVLGADHFGNLNVEWAIKLGEFMAQPQYKLAYLEDLIGFRSRNAVNLMKQITAGSPTPTQGYEDIFAFEGFRPFIDAGALDIIHPDMSTSGGLIETKKIADYAYMFGIPTMIHQAGGPVGAIAAVHCAAAMQDFISIENHCLDIPWWDDLVTGIDKPLIQDGSYTVPEKPGLGIELNDEECKKYLREKQYVNKTGYFEPTPEFDEPMNWQEAQEKGIISRRAAWRGPWIHLDEEGNLVNRADGR